MTWFNHGARLINMRIFHIILILFLSTLCSSKADEVKKFEIGQITVGESLLNHMTKNQIYSALQINNHRNNFGEKESKMTTELINNVFAVIPFENKSTIWGITCFTSDKNRFKRKYSGPVNINRLHIKLLDDKGNIMNLNGGEWSFSMMSSHLYQY